MTITTHSELSDAQLVTELHRLIRVERHATAQVIAHLAEVERRRIHLAAGYPSMFAYCTESLGLSEHEAFHRILAARTAVRFPVVLDMLAGGRVTLTTVKLASPHLTPDNHVELLDRIAGRTRREVEVLLATRFPEPDVPMSIRRVPEPAVPSRARSEPVVPPGLPAPPVAAAPPLPSFVATSPPRTLSATKPHCEPRPISPARYHVSFTASEATIDKLREAQDLLANTVPSRDVAEIVDRALSVLLDELHRRKHAATARPRVAIILARNGRDIPAAVQRAVWERDDGRCAFIGRHGRCSARRHLEFHHVVPYEAGGQATVENIQLRCRAHNQYEADVFFAASRAGRDGVPTWPGPSADASMSRRH